MEEKCLLCTLIVLNNEIVLKSSEICIKNDHIKIAVSNFNYWNNPKYFTYKLDECTIITRDNSIDTIIVIFFPKKLTSNGNRGY